MTSTWIFQHKPYIVSTGVVGGPVEKNGAISKDFDTFYDDLWMREKSYEKAHRVLIEDAVKIALEKGKVPLEEVSIFLSGDLINQITPSSFAARTNGLPYLGLFSACASSMEGLALSALILNSGQGNFALTGAASHNSAVEKQFRYPTEYGSQKPPTAQYTVTGAGYALVGKGQLSSGPEPRITSATIGKVMDLGIKDPFNMGGAMAPAAVDTITRHLNERGVDSNYYDLIITGDLATIGSATAHELLKEKGIHLSKDQFQDCGLKVYTDDQPILAGASGAGCSATVLYGHLVNEMRKGTYKKILVVATGALLSPVSFQQKESIPCIAHGVSIEYC
ncbi:SpoVAD [Bacillus coahuilensis p1.1.43]|uniref:SpoVAD n=1 Tax=Bacillus coahuilensis p1.1.43 TaxID=1150625 RepID=A0A147KA95_9BACI|nr:stage V sporulation protein AD [Bacillus coahuilensis]KUP07548.1 SpoVAD [Bacillus coahuilensis p1.1.43]